MSRERLVVIDGKSVLYRGYYAMGDLATPSGHPTGATYGFALMGLRILQEFDPDYVVVAWDKSKTNIRARQQLYADYKANRKPMPDDLVVQLDDVRQLCAAFGWPLLEVDDFEADDIMGTLAVQAKQQGIDSVLVTSDLDVLQLVNHHTRVCALKRGLTQTILYDEDSFREEYEMTPQQFVDYKALRGDPSDNIPGVKGVGEKTARQLIGKYGNMDAIYEHLDEIGGATAHKLEADRDMAFLSRELIKLSLEAPVEFDDVAARVGASDPTAIAKVFYELGFRRLHSELPDYMQLPADPSLFDVSGGDNSPYENWDVEEITSADRAWEVLGQEVIVYSVMEHNSRTQLPDIHEVIFTSEQGKAYHSKATDVLKQLPDVFAGRKIIGFGLHEDLRAWGPVPDAVYFDISLTGFLLDPLAQVESIYRTAAQELGVDERTFDEGWAVSPLKKRIVSMKAAVLNDLYERRSEKLRQFPELEKLAHDIEFPLLPVIAGMERYGIKLETEYLERMQQEFIGRIKELEQAIHEHAGEEFNINSPQQLQTVLFEKLQLDTDGIKKTKTGFSTGASELEKLRGLHPIVDYITHYRELTKLKSTYIDALPKLVADDGRLHTTFTQTVAQTGRLSSLHPNLQNIPVRTEEGRAIRRAFVAEDGYRLAQADYSQIELRVAAALSGDDKMIQAFSAGADIHVQTAAELHGVTPQEVSKELRYSAKTVNFGVLYGMSPHGLSIATGMSRDEAKDFIDRYFGIRSQLLEYLESLKTKAKADGYVETLFGRRRPMPDIHSSNFAVRAAAERAAMNMPIQGTAADIMKMAMVEIDKRLDAGSHQILQVHDSILVEAPKAKTEQVTEMLREVMENVYDLGVPLDVDVSTGKHWGEL